jgi:hypothetical protein
MDIRTETSIVATRKEYYLKGGSNYAHIKLLLALILLFLQK